MNSMRHDYKGLKKLIDLNCQQGNIKLRQADFEGAFKSYNKMLEVARIINLNNSPAFR